MAKVSLAQIKNWFRTRLKPTQAQYWDTWDSFWHKDEVLPQVQSDWNQATDTAKDFIKNKPTIPAAQVQSDWNQATDTAKDFIKNKPTIPAAQVQSDWNQATNTEKDFIKNKPTIPAAQVQSDWNQETDTAKDFIKNKPTIPAAQVQSDWNQATDTAKDFIKNKPTIPAAQVQSDWNQATATEKDFIKNKPSVVSPGNFTDTDHVEWDISNTPETGAVIKANSIGFTGTFIDLEGNTVNVVKGLIKSKIEPVKGLKLTWNDIANVPVLDVNSVSDWNTFFDLPEYITPFSSVVVTDNTVTLIGGEGEISLKEALFQNNANLLSIEDTIGCIVGVLDDCFWHCTSLTSVILPMLQLCGFGSFRQSAIISVSFPNLTSAGASCFYGCADLLSVSLPLLETSENELFSACTSLTAISLPALTVAGNNSFAHCEALTSISLPTLNSAGQACFTECTSLVSISLPALVNADMQLFDTCTSLTTVSLPSLTDVGSELLSSCTSVTSVSIPSCINLGGTPGNDYTFFNITGKTISLTIPATLMTCNSGTPDGDIAQLQANNTVTIITT